MPMPFSKTDYIEIAVPLPVYQTYHYTAPKPLMTTIQVGKRALVPFGLRKITGYILGPANISEPREIKNIVDILDEYPLFPESMVRFFRWIADYYLHPIGEVIKDALPGGLDFAECLIIGTAETKKESAADNLTPIESKILSRLASGPCSLKSLYKKLKPDFPVSLIYSLEKRGYIQTKRELRRDRTKPKMERYLSLLDGGDALNKRSKLRQQVLAAVSAAGEISAKSLSADLPGASRVIKPLAASGHLAIIEKRVYRDPFGESITPDIPPTLTSEQLQAVSRIEASLGKGFCTYLLAGVTGSGKTEIYMQLADTVIGNGASVLVLVPEIALISQIEKRFRARFGDCVSLLHSGLSAGERYDQWSRASNGDASIAIGARSAIFAPFSRIGLIIVDEEHDTSYKQEGGLRYNARDLAVVRARQMDCVVILGSATPSIQSYYNTRAKKYVEIRLAKRIENRSLPAIQVVDLRKSRDKKGIEKYLTPALCGAIDRTLKNNEQALLFLNRRGYASYPVCTACGEAIKCKHCDISLTLHQRANAYKCHYCGYTQSAASACAACKSSKISLLGLGTEKVENAVKSLFPSAVVCRMDRDTTARKGALLKLLKGLRDGSIDILVGTQMVAKGHDFPNITTVGIICADLSLSFPDFRAAERTFQLLAQVSGRAGRGKSPGRVILQTYSPEHFSILSAREQDFKAFYDEDIRFRKSLRYPPFSRMILLRISGKDKKDAARHASRIGTLCHELQKSEATFTRNMEIMGPIEAAMPRIAGRYRWQIMVKGLKSSTLHRYTRKLLSDNPSLLSNRSVRLTVDVDPFLMM